MLPGGYYSKNGLFGIIRASKPGPGTTRRQPGSVMVPGPLVSALASGLVPRQLLPSRRTAWHASGVNTVTSPGGPRTQTCSCSPSACFRHCSESMAISSSSRSGFPGTRTSAQTSCHARPSPACTTSGCTPAYLRPAGPAFGPAHP